jgi:hypothetical protein
MSSEAGAREAVRIDAVLDRARAEQTAGRISRALALVRSVVDEPLVQRTCHWEVLFWQAQLAADTGDHAAAAAAAMAATSVATTRLEALRSELLCARIAGDALDLDRCAAVLAALRDDRGDLGPPIVERVAAILDWIARLRIGPNSPAGLAVLRVEIALVLANLWSERGKYRSACAAIDTIRDQLPAASDEIDADQVTLFEIELRLACGEIAAASNLVAAIPEPASPLAGVRIALVAARVAFAAGRLSDARAKLPDIRTIPSDARGLLTSVAALRIAIESELNLFETAQATARDAISRIGDDIRARDHVVLLERASQGAALRLRSAVALWELPALIPRPAEHDPELDHLDEPLCTSATDRMRYTAAWTSAANAVLEALASGDRESAVRHADQLAALTEGVESDYISARVRFARALVELHSEAPGECARELIDVAGVLHGLGARLAEAQVTRHAARAAARLGRRADYIALATRAAEILDEVAAELAPAERGAYLLNKWSGRDELAAELVRELCGDAEGLPRHSTARERCRVFRAIDALTHWPLDRAFGDGDADRLAADAVPDLARRWVEQQLAATASATPRHVPLPTWLNLWWFPRRTVVLHYHVLPDRTFVFRIARGYIDVSILPIGRVHLQRNMQALVESASDLAALAVDLGIVDTLRRFPGVERLVIVPHEVIAEVPFAALLIDGVALCERVTLSQIDRLGQLRRGRAVVRGDRVLGLAISNYTGSGLPDLRSAEPEVLAALAALDSPEPPLLGTEASIERVMAALPTANVLHAAAHGRFDADSPASSGIVLRCDPDGFSTLTLEALRRLDLRRMRLAVLATCRSAEGTSLPGRVRICIPTALLAAGARGVLASLWPVDDDASLGLMTEFYGALRTLPPSRALARVQRTTSAPKRHWAGLVFYGSD